MTALDTLFNIANNEKLSSYDFRYCLVDSNKHPFRIDGEFAKPNCNEDFSSLQELAALPLERLDSYAGLGVSIQASNVCAIDIDHCASNKFDVDSIDYRARDIIGMFKDFAYIEFSFSGNGIRIFFKAKQIPDYEQCYYTKNSNFNVEYYCPEGSARYVTITGQTIHNNSIRDLSYKEQDILIRFLEKYMKRKYKLSVSNNEVEKDDRSIDELMKKVKYLYLTNNNFQELWFEPAPGSGHDESERDYHLIASLYDYVTKDKDKVKALFEQSMFFKTKDWKHISKWNKQDNRYFNYLYDKIHSKGD